MSKIGFIGLLVAAAAMGQPPRVGVGAAERRMTLKGAIEQALAANLDIEIERTYRAEASAVLRGAGGPWDPTFRWSPAIDRRNTPAGSLLVGSGGRLSEHLHTQNLYFRQRLPGQSTMLGLDFENHRQTSSNPFETLSPAITSRLTLSVVQPLLRDRAVDRERSELRVRRKQLDISEIDFELRAIEIVTRVQQAYWDLAAARQDAQVQADAVEWAREQLARNQRMIDAGTLAPAELAASEAEVERRLDAWYTAVGLITEAENSMKTLLAADIGDPLWNDRIVPVEDASLPPPETHADTREAVAEAVRLRPELRKLAGLRDVNQVQQEQARDAVKPQMNLVGAFTNTGLGGAINTAEDPFTASTAAMYQRLNQLSAQAGLVPLAPPTLGGLPEGLVGGYGTTLSNLFGGNYRSVSVGLAFDFNPRNTAAHAELARTAVAERRLKLQRAQAEQVIAAEVRDALQALQTAQQRVAAAEAGAHAAGRKLESETRLFQTGESTNFLVLTRQNEYAGARHRLTVARLDYNKAVARLAQALGTTLRDHGIMLH